MTTNFPREERVDKFAGEPALAELKRIRGEHASAVAQLQQQVEGMGGQPDTDAGAWGAFTTALQGTANLFGENSALSMIRKGEEHGANDYEDALADDEVSPNAKEVIHTELLPRTKRHLAALDALGRD